MTGKVKKKSGNFATENL